MAKDTPRVGLTPYERDLLQGMVYVLCDARAEDPFSHIIGVFDSPTKAIEATHTDPAVWHHYCEHYWMGNGGQWEVTPFILNNEVEWKKREWEEARPRVHVAKGMGSVRIDEVGPVIDPKRAQKAELSEKILQRLHLDGS